MNMGLNDLLQAGLKMVGGMDATPQAPGQVTQNGVPGDIGSALSQAMRSSSTPPFGEYVSQLFGQSTPGQQAGLLNQILASVGPAALSGVAGGVLGRLMTPGQTQLTAEQAAQVTPADAAAIAGAAEAQQPAVIEQVAQFYSQHSTMINSLGAAALAAVVSRMQSPTKT